MLNKYTKRILSERQEYKSTIFRIGSSLGGSDWVNVSKWLVDIMVEVSFHIMIDKLKSGVWEKATTTTWQENDGQFVTLKNTDGRLSLLLHESHDRVTGWTLNVNDSLNMKFIELKL